jgi:hypothetical protein
MPYGVHPRFIRRGSVSLRRQEARRNDSPILHELTGAFPLFRPNTLRRERLRRAILRPGCLGGIGRP